jgi:uncharacterized membrane-anchored protein
MKLKVLLVVLALQAAWILGTTFQQERALRVGKAILLETERVDPRDLLRGDYLILNYKISSVLTNLFSTAVDPDMTPGTKVYVALEQRGNFHVVVRADTKPIEVAGNEVLLLGQSRPRSWNNTNAVSIEYGLERFYVAEGTGNPQGKLTVQAVVPASGRAMIKQVFVDGVPYAEAMSKKRTGQ